MTPPNTTPLNEEDRLGEIKAVVRDGLANHTGEFANPWIFKGSYSHELLADILNDIMASERLFKNLTNLIQTIEKKAAIMGAKYGNAAFRQYNIANPGKPINLDETLRMGIEQATAWVEGKV